MLIAQADSGMGPAVVAALMATTAALGVMGKVAHAAVVKKKNSNTGPPAQIGLIGGDKSSTTSFLNASAVLERLQGIETTSQGNHEAIAVLDTRMTAIERELNGSSDKLNDVHEWLNPEKRGGIHEKVDLLTEEMGRVKKGLGKVLIGADTDE